MEPIIFEPINSSFWSTTFLSLLTFLIAAIGIYFFTITKKVTKHYRNIFSLLCFFAAMMALGSAIFSWFHGERIGQIKITEKEVQTAYGVLPFSNIKEVLIKKENKSASLLVPTVTGEYDNYLILITKENDYLYFSEVNYPIKEIISPLRKRWMAYNKKGSSE